MSIPLTLKIWFWSGQIDADEGEILSIGFGKIENVCKIEGLNIKKRQNRQNIARGHNIMRSYHMIVLVFEFWAFPLARNYINRNVWKVYFYLYKILLNVPKFLLSLGNSMLWDKLKPESELSNDISMCLSIKSVKLDKLYSKLFSEWEILKTLRSYCR